MQHGLQAVEAEAQTVSFHWKYKATLRAHDRRDVPCARHFDLPHRPWFMPLPPFHEVQQLNRPQHLHRFHGLTNHGDHPFMSFDLRKVHIGPMHLITRNHHPAGIDRHLLGERVARRTTREPRHRKPFLQLHHQPTRQAALHFHLPHLRKHFQPLPHILEINVEHMHVAVQTRHPRSHLRRNRPVRLKLKFPDRIGRIRPHRTAPDFLRMHREKQHKCQSHHQLARMPQRPPQPHGPLPARWRHFHRQPYIRTRPHPERAIPPALRTGSFGLRK